MNKSKVLSSVITEVESLINVRIFPVDEIHYWVFDTETNQARFYELMGKRWVALGNIDNFSSVESFIDINIE